MCGPVRVGLWLPGLLSLLLVGCGSSGNVPLVPVSGRVTMDDKPLPKATVHFTPEKQAGKETSPDAHGVTDEEGKYTLTTTLNGKDREGAAPGKYRVRISILNRDPASKAKLGEQLPARYNSESKLDFTVSAAGTSEANFKLTRK